MSCRTCTFVGVAAGLAGLAVVALGFGPSLNQSSSPAAPARQTTPSATPAASAPAAGGLVKCAIDDTHSLALFRVHHLGASRFWGRFNGVTGTFAFTPNSADGMAFDVTINTDSVDTGVEKLDQHLKSPDFFAAKDFPEMKFVSSGAKKVGDNLFDVSGTLTIRGTSKPLTAKLEYTGMGGGKRAGFEAVFTIKRSEFGVSYGVDGGALSDDVRVVVCLEGLVEGAAKPEAKKD